MNDSCQDIRILVRKLQRFLPLSAHVRPALIKSLRARRPIAANSPMCVVTHVFDAGEEHGLMCQLEFSAGAKSMVLVAPIGHLSFNRRDPISREIAAYRKRRFKRRQPAGSNAQDNDHVSIGS